MTLTADNITDEQIRELFCAGVIDGDTAHVALIHDAWPKERHAARARCAEILNERAIRALRDDAEAADDLTTITLCTAALLPSDTATFQDIGRVEARRLLAERFPEIAS